MAAPHVSVMVEEVIGFLSPAPGAVFFDLSLGGGGHSLAVLEAIQPSGVLIGCDRDGGAVQISRERLARFGGFARLHHANFADLKRILAEEGYEAVDGALFDLGLSSMQLDSPERGFRFDSPEPLDMRMDRRQERTAADLVNGLAEAELADLIYKFGEERKSRSIARSIGRARARKPIERCDELAAIVSSAVARKGGGGRGRRPRIHPATRTFQALRIAVNDELDVLEGALRDAVDVLRPGGRIVVISFHSLEDRIVKNLFRALSRGGEGAPSPTLRLLTRKVVRPGAAEVAANRRARSARLRAAERIAGGGGVEGAEGA